MEPQKGMNTRRQGSLGASYRLGITFIMLLFPSKRKQIPSIRNVPNLVVPEKGYSLLLNMHSLLHSICEILCVTSFKSNEHSEKNLLLDNSRVAMLCQPLCFSWAYVFDVLLCVPQHKASYSDLKGLVSVLTGSC